MVERQRQTITDTETHVRAVENPPVSDVQFLYGEIRSVERKLIVEKEQNNNRARELENLIEFAKLSSGVIEELRRILSNEKFAKKRETQKAFNEKGEQWYKEFTEKHIDWCKMYNEFKKEGRYMID